jgi:hypothetical protein
MESFKSVLELAGTLGGGVAAAVAAVSAYGLILLSRRPEVCILAIDHWPAGKLRNTSIISAEIAIRNAGMGSKSVMVAEVDRLIFEQPGRVCSMSPYALLEPLELGGKAESERKSEGETGQRGAAGAESQGKTEFEPKVKKLVHPVFMIGCGQSVQHLMFIPDQGNVYGLSAGELKIRVRIKYTMHNPLFRVFSRGRERTLEVKYGRKVEEREADRATVDECAWLGRDLEEVKD